MTRIEPGGVELRLAFVDSCSSRRRKWAKVEGQIH